LLHFGPELLHFPVQLKDDAIKGRLALGLWPEPVEATAFSVAFTRPIPLALARLIGSRVAITPDVPFTGPISLAESWLVGSCITIAADVPIPTDVAIAAYVHVASDLAVPWRVIRLHHGLAKGPEPDE
jgi:hypothetical protein